MKSKKMLSLILALAMSLSSLCVSVLAAESVSATYEDGRITYSGAGFAPNESLITVEVYDTQEKRVEKSDSTETDADGAISGSMLITKRVGEDLNRYVIFVRDFTNQLKAEGKITKADAGTDATTGTGSNAGTGSGTSTGSTVTPPAIVEDKDNKVIFSDVDGNAFYAAAVAWAVDHKPQITNGTDTTHFSPNAICTRAQVVTFLWRAAGAPEPKTNTTRFSDLGSTDSFYYKAVLWAVENGITNGTDETHFSPDATVTRGQVVTFLYRYEKAAALAGNRFEDVAAGEFYAGPVNWAYVNGITNGTSDTTFSPNNGCTRGEIVTFLYRDIVK